MRKLLQVRCRFSRRDVVGSGVVRKGPSQQRVQKICIPEESKVVYKSKNGKKEKVFDPLE